MKEVDLQHQCNKYLKDNDIPFIHIERGRYEKSHRHRKGIPDLIIYKNNKLILIELKSEGKVLTHEQEKFMEKWYDEGAQCYLIYNFNRFKTIIEKKLK